VVTQLVIGKSVSQWVESEQNVRPISCIVLQRC